MSTNCGPHRGRRLTREEFQEIVHDYRTETEARANGKPIPPPTARRRAVPAMPVVLAHPAPNRAYRRIFAAANDNHRPAAIVPTSISTPDRVANALPAPLRRTLFRLRELARPVDTSVPVITLAAANNNAADDTGNGIDHRHDIRPGEKALDDLIDAFADGMRTRVVADKKGRIERFVGGIHYYRSVRGSGEIVEFGGRSSLGQFFGLRTHRGNIVAYAKNGKRQQPSYEIGDPRGADDAELPRETTATPAAHPVLAEIERGDDFADFCARVEPETARLLRVIMDADSFLEVARAADMTPTAHNGRRITEKMLVEAEKLLAA